jgi:hypothetical protein
MWLRQSKGNQFAADDRKRLGRSPGYDCGRRSGHHGSASGHDRSSGCCWGACHRWSGHDGCRGIGERER